VFQVVVEQSLAAETPLAYGARIGCFPSVNSTVDFERTLLTETLGAEFAYERSRFGVNTHVLVQVFAASERVSANFAYILFLASVHGHVHAQLSLVYVGLSAYL
jgi:hypothetical protein